MSAPEQRLLSDAAAGRFEQEASCALATVPLTPPAVESMARAVVMLCRDREARIEFTTRRTAKDETAASSKSRYAVWLTQDRIDLLASLLVKAETVFDTSAPGCIAAEKTAALLTDLREQTTTVGASDPYPDRPLWPHFEDVETAGKNRSRVAQERAD